MSKSRRAKLKNVAELELSELPTAASRADESARLSFLKHWWVIGLIALLTLGATGAGLKYLEDDAQRQRATNRQFLAANSSNEGWLNSINPFVESPLLPTPAPTPQLSREYIYAGSRMLAVEDADASAAPPADLAVWRIVNGTGTWYVMGGTGSQQTSYAWGGTDDKPVPGDYDGDGKTDFSIFRPSNGTWYIVNSSTGAGTSLTFGAAGDQPAPADFDGDGKTDAAVYRVNPSTGLATWYIQRSQAGFVSMAFGASSDIAAPADYDGDGKADIAVRRGSDQKFYVLRSSDNQIQVQQLGASSDAPVSADYDGDGKADFALRSTVTSSTWLILQSSTNTTETIGWGQLGETAVHNDYDGDGKVDIALWRESNGTWYIRQSALGNSLRQVAWGMMGDKPVPAFYRR